MKLWHPQAVPRDFLNLITIAPPPIPTHYAFLCFQIAKYTALVFYVLCLKTKHLLPPFFSAFLSEIVALLTDCGPLLYSHPPLFVQACTNGLRYGPEKSPETINWYGHPYLRVASVCFEIHTTRGINQCGLLLYTGSICSTSYHSLYTELPDVGTTPIISRLALTVWRHYTCTWLCYRQPMDAPC